MGVIRKIFYCCGLGGQALGLIGLYFTRTRLIRFYVNHLDVAPQFSSIIMGFSNCVAALTDIFSFVLTNYMLDNTDYYDMKNSWNNVFLTCTLILIGGLVVSIFFPSGELQAWAKTNNSESGIQLENNQNRKPTYTNAA